MARSKGGIHFSQRKYLSDILKDTRLLGTRPVGTPIDPNVKISIDQGEFHCLVGRYLIYS